MHRIATSMFAVTLLAGSAAQALTSEGVAAVFRGEWVPAKAACTSPLKLVIEANAVSFVNGGQRMEYRKLEQCFACMGGHQEVQKITMLSTDAMGDSPFVIYHDRSKKTAALTVDFSNDKKLGARFPLGTAALKKCP